MTTLDTLTNTTSRINSETAISTSILAGKTLTPIQQMAMKYYAMGFNIGPTRPASKIPFLWRCLVGTRIHPHYLIELFDQRAGIFVLTGRLSRNLYILDCETAESAEEHAAKFRRRGLAPWVVKTARAKHFWMLSPDGEVANLKHKSGLWEIRGNLLYALCPPSVHPSSAIYEWEFQTGELPPSIPITALDWLPLELALKPRNKFLSKDKETDPLTCLSPATRDFIRNGANEGTRNNSLFAAACDLAGNNFSLPAARDLLIPPAAQCGLTRNEIRDTLNSAYRRTRKPARKEPGASPVPPVYLRAYAWAQSHHWKPLVAEVATKSPSAKCRSIRYAVTRDTASAVFQACCERSRRDSARVFRATTREIAELARVKSETAHRALVCLVENGYLRRCGYSKVRAALFTFGKQVLQKGDSTTHWTVHSVPFSQQTGGEAFMRGALGKTAERVWHIILVKPLTAAELARRLDVNRSTVGHALEKLNQFGLAEKDSQRRWFGNAAGEEYFVEVAAKCGTLGSLARRKEQHAKERSIYVSEAILRAKRRWEATQIRQSTN